MSEFADVQPASESVEVEEMASMFDLKLKKKKKKDGKEKKSKKNVEVVEESEEKIGAADGTETLEAKEGSSDLIVDIYDPPIYSYGQLLNRVIDFVHQNNPELTDKKRYTLKPPQLMRGFISFFCYFLKKILWVNYTSYLYLKLLTFHNNIKKVGTKKTLWVNFQEICTMMRRNADHVFQFMMAELGTEGSIDGNKRLVIRGKFVPKVLRFFFFFF
jgi:translation initiation factor 2 subunit 2